MSKPSALDRLNEISGGKPATEQKMETKVNPARKEKAEDRKPVKKKKATKKGNVGKYFMIDPMLIIVLGKIQMQEQEAGTKKPTESSLVEEGIRLLAKEKGVQID